MARHATSLVKFDWSRVTLPRFEGADLRSAFLDGQRIDFRTQLGRDLAEVKAMRPLKWSVEATPCQIRPVRLTTFRARFEVDVAEAILTMEARVGGFDLADEQGLAAKQRRSTLWHRPGVVSGSIAACLAINAFRLDRRVIISSVLLDNVELLGRRPGVFKSRP